MEVDTLASHTAILWRFCGKMVTFFTDGLDIFVEQPHFVENMGDLCFSDANVSIWDVRFQNVCVLSVLIPEAHSHDRLARWRMLRSMTKILYVKSQIINSCNRSGLKARERERKSATRRESCRVLGWWHNDAQGNRWWWRTSLQPAPGAFGGR